MNQVAVVTGAGSGVGRAVAGELLRLGWSVALVGRTDSSLHETIAQAGADAKSRALALSADISKPAAVAELVDRVLAWRPTVDVLVNSAGTNLPKRGWDVLAYEGYRELIDVNLTGTFLCVQAFLPAMRRQGSGTIVNVVSDAALAASPKAGPAYVASKFGQRGLTQSINAEERSNGIRACAVLPGDIDTPLLERRPQPPSAEARQRMLQPADVARCVLLCIQLPPRAIIEELLVRPR